MKLEVDAAWSSAVRNEIMPNTKYADHRIRALQGIPTEQAGRQEAKKLYLPAQMWEKEDRRQRTWRLTSDMLDHF